MSDCVYVPLADKPQPLTVGPLADIYIWSPDSKAGIQIPRSAMLEILKKNYRFFSIVDATDGRPNVYSISGYHDVDWDQEGLDFMQKTEHFSLHPSKDEDLSAIEHLLTKEVDGKKATLIRNPEQKMHYLAGTSEPYHLDNLKAAMGEFMSYGFESILHVPDATEGSITDIIVATPKIVMALKPHMEGKRFEIPNLPK